MHCISHRDFVSPRSFALRDSQLCPEISVAVERGLEKSRRRAAENDLASRVLLPCPPPHLLK